MVLRKIAFSKTTQFASYVTIATLGMSLVACSGTKGLGSSNASGSPTAAFEKAGNGLKIEKINGINVISKASIESYLDDLKNNVTSLASKSFNAMQKSGASEFAKQSWSEVTNEPLEVMGYRFENLVDWSLALEEQIQTDLSEFSTMGEYLKSGGVNSGNDLQLEGIEDNLLAAEEFFAQDPLAWLQENQSGSEQDGLSLQEQQEEGDKLLSLPTSGRCPLPTGILPPNLPISPTVVDGGPRGRNPSPSSWPSGFGHGPQVPVGTTPQDSPFELPSREPPGLVNPCGKKGPQVVESEL